MARIVKCGLVQTGCRLAGSEPIDEIRQVMVEENLSLALEAASQGVQILCLPELSTGPYFPAEQHSRWFALAERIPEGETVRHLQELAREKEMVLIVPLFEVEMPGMYYNTAAVIDADGSYLGKYRKQHLPHLYPGFWEKFYFRPGNLGFPVFRTAYADMGVLICYDRHFPEAARALGLGGAEIVFNPSATVAGLSEHLWAMEQPAHAVANGYFIAASNRTGVEKPWSIGEFYGRSYFCDPRGRILVQGSRDQHEVVTAELDLDTIQEVRAAWQFYRDRRPESYGDLVKP